MFRRSWESWLIITHFLPSSDSRFVLTDSCESPSWSGLEWLWCLCHMFIRSSAKPNWRFWDWFLICCIGPCLHRDRRGQTSPLQLPVNRCKLADAWANFIGCWALCFVEPDDTRVKQLKIWDFPFLRHEWSTDKKQWSEPENSQLFIGPNLCHVQVCYSCFNLFTDFFGTNGSRAFIGCYFNGAWCRSMPSLPPIKETF